MRDWNKDGKHDMKDRYFDYKMSVGSDNSDTHSSRKKSYRDDRETDKITFHPENILPMMIIIVLVSIPAFLIKGCLMGF